MRVYLAARYSRYVEMQDYARVLTDAGYEVASRWIRGDHELRACGESEAARWQRQWAMEDWQDVREADIVLSFTESPGEHSGRSRGGRHVEYGLALAWGKRCLVVGDREHVFHWLPEVEYYASWEEALRVLTGQAPVRAERDGQR
mgnify:CR=1 FL=1